MNSVYSEIKKLRHDKFSKVIDDSTNRYCAHYQELDGTKTAYFFSVPIRSNHNNNIVDLKFQHKNKHSIFNGSNCKISISDKIRIINEHGQCEIILPCKFHMRTENAIFFRDDLGEIEIRPTLNGIILFFDNKLASSNKEIKLHLNKKFEGTRTNSKYFSIMREKFIPFVTVSCIGLINSHERIYAPCEVFAKESGDQEYVLNFKSNNSQNRIAIEINIQEQKLFQDTTVESLHPKENNAFGGVAFLGTGKMFGEQWLYSRLDITKLNQIQGKKIIKSILHIPQLGYNNSPITISNLSDRFCSFGSNWENKISIKERIALSCDSLGYYHLDMTKLLGRFTTKSENFVIKGITPTKNVIIPTGDSFYSPQILEVKYQ